MITCNGLKRQLKQSGLSQNKFAEIVGMDPSRFSRILRGLSTLSLPEIGKICEALDCQPCDVIEREVHECAATDVN